MKGNRHPITEIDFGHTIQMIAKDFHRSQSQPQDDVKIVDLGVSDVQGTPSDCFQVTFPRDQALGYYAYRSKICVGKTTHLPTMIVIWDHNEQVIEKYIYRQVKTNVGLRDEDFDPKNPQYNYK